jgi:hypothetical protein
VIGASWGGLLAFTMVILVGGEHHVGRVEGEVVELGVAWNLLDETFIVSRVGFCVSLVVSFAFVS